MLNDARCMVASIYLAQDTIFHSFASYFISLSPFPPHLRLPHSLISISRVISIFLASLSPFYLKRGNTANDSLRFAYLWEHCLFILLYLAEMEIHQIKIENKTKRQSSTYCQCLPPSRPPFLLLQTTFYAEKLQTKTC